MPLPRTIVGFSHLPEVGHLHSTLAFAVCKIFMLVEATQRVGLGCNLYQHTDRQPSSYLYLTEISGASDADPLSPLCIFVALLPHSSLHICTYLSTNILCFTFLRYCVFPHPESSLHRYDSFFVPQPLFFLHKSMFISQMNVYICLHFCINCNVGEL